MRLKHYLMMAPWCLLLTLLAGCTEDIGMSANESPHANESSIQGDLIENAKLMVGGMNGGIPLFCTDQTDGKRTSTQTRSAVGEDYVIEWEEALTLQDGEEKVAIVPIHHKARTANVLLTKHGRTKKSINKVVSKLIIRQRNNSSDHPIIIMGTYVCERSYFDNYKTNLILFPICLKELISLDIS